MLRFAPFVFVVFMLGCGAERRSNPTEPGEAIHVLAVQEVSGALLAAGEVAPSPDERRPAFLRIPTEGTPAPEVVSQRSPDVFWRDVVAWRGGWLAATDDDETLRWVSADGADEELLEHGIDDVVDVRPLDGGGGEIVVRAAFGGAPTLVYSETGALSSTLGASCPALGIAGEHLYCVSSDKVDFEIELTVFDLDGDEVGRATADANELPFGRDALDLIGGVAVVERTLVYTGRAGFALADVSDPARPEWVDGAGAFDDPWTRWHLLGGDKALVAFPDGLSVATLTADGIALGEQLRSSATLGFSALSDGRIVVAKGTEGVELLAVDGSDLRPVAGYARRWRQDALHDEPFLRTDAFP